MIFGKIRESEARCTKIDGGEKSRSVRRKYIESKNFSLYLISRSLPNKWTGKSLARRGRRKFLIKHTLVKFGISVEEEGEVIRNYINMKFRTILRSTPEDRVR